MKTKKSSFFNINKIILGCGICCAPIVNADFFTFPKDSTLNETQQRCLKALFITSTTSGTKNLEAEFLQKDFAEHVKSWVKDGKDLSDLVQRLLLNGSRKEQDLKIILDASADNLTNTDDAYMAAIQDTNDGLFNGIIRETLKMFKNYIVDDTDDTGQLQEAFDVVWNGVVNANTSPQDFKDFLNKILEIHPSSKIAEFATAVMDAPGPNLCAKIANYLGETFTEKVDEVIQSKCCACATSTYKAVTGAIGAILPYISEITKLIIVIVGIVQ